MTAWLPWQALERSIPLDELPKFHRAFLALHRPETDWDAAPLRQIQSRVGATLKALEREGRAETREGRLFVDAAALPEGFESYYA